MAKTDPEAMEPPTSDKMIPDTVMGDISLAEGDQLERGLKSRHIQFLALGGACVKPPVPTAPEKIRLMANALLASAPVCSLGLVRS